MLIYDYFFLSYLGHQAYAYVNIAADFLYTEQKIPRRRNKSLWCCLIHKKKKVFFLYRRYVRVIVVNKGIMVDCIEKKTTYQFTVMH